MRLMLICFHPYLAPAKLVELEQDDYDELSVWWYQQW